MNFLFKLNGLELTNTEANSLLQIANNKDAFVVDLGRHIDAKVLNAPDLFALSIEKKDPTLAALASKIAFSNLETKRPAKKIESTVAKPTVLRLVKRDDFIQEALEHPSYKTVGAAMLLSFVSGKDFTAIRETALHFVNRFWSDEKFPEKSLIFKGFKNDGLDGGRLIPVENEHGLARTETYYVSPVYLAITAGLKMLQQHGFVTTEIRWSYGSRKASPDTRAESTRRKYFVFRLTEAGMQVKSEWGDIDRFVSNFWRNRINQSAA